MRNKKFSGTQQIPDEAPSASQLLNALFDALRERLPSSLGLDISFNVRRDSASIDALLAIKPPGGPQTTIAVETKRQLDPKDVPSMVAQLHHCVLPQEQLCVVAPFLGQRTRDLLTEAHVNYMDATGNLRLETNKPLIYIERSGANTNPWKEFRPLRSLKGAAAGRVVRALCDFRPPFGVRELAERSQTPVATVSRVVTLLDSEALLTRGSRGRVLEVQWPQLIERWTQDYAVTTSNATTVYLEPRGLDALLEKLKDARWPYAVTGAIAAVRVAPLAPPRLAVLYVQDTALAAANLVLRQAERGANVLLAQPFDSVVYERTVREGGITYAALSQVAADLLTSPGRGPEMGEELMRWMKENEDVWRQ